jgi:hypothetical protein
LLRRFAPRNDCGCVGWRWALGQRRCRGFAGSDGEGNSRRPPCLFGQAMATHVGGADAVKWLKAPADHEVIRRWTAEPGAARHALALPPPDDPDCFDFLVIGDTGDSEAVPWEISPQDAVAERLAADAALPDTGGSGRFVLHLGDVVYMTGERRLYERNFRRPYTPFLTPDSTVDNLVFRLPFLPVPGNHDYYDPGRWSRVLAQVPPLATGLRAMARRLFRFGVPLEGSDGGSVYMRAFVGANGRNDEPLEYVPEQQTRLPNRYYRFRVGTVEFFALDSNTLGAPPPSQEVGRVRRDARIRLDELEQRAHALDRELRRDQAALDRWRRESLRRAADDPAALAKARERAQAVADALRDCADRLQRDEVRRAASVLQDWQAANDRLRTSTGSTPLRALLRLDELVFSLDEVQRAAEERLSHLLEGAEHRELETARDRLERARLGWSAVGGAAPGALETRMQELSERALDVQRELAAERQRIRYRPEDHDREQLRWLDEALRQAEREAPDGWRIVYLHHPPYTTIGNHCERPYIQNLRRNLLPVIQGRVHAVFGGHAHAFEWIRNRTLPTTGFFISGGGGQVWLRRSVLDPTRRRRSREQYQRLRQAGVAECAVAGRGPQGDDGAPGFLFHYLRVSVTPDRLVVRPVGVRLTAAGYRTECPIPVFHAAELPPEHPPWQRRELDCIEVRREAPPRAVWAQGDP